MSRILLVILTLLFFAENSNSQCYPDRHNTTWYDGWISCEAAVNPNPARGYTHWIMYDLGQQYELGQLHVWNSNDPDNLDFGLKDIIIDYSLNAIEWNELGNFELDYGMGNNIYEGADVVNFEKAKAQYVLITAESNYGGDCYGLAEIRFELDSSASFIDEPQEQLNACLQVLIYPNPFSDEVNINIESKCSGEIYYTITDAFGITISSRKELPEHFDGFLGLNSSSWKPGFYFLIIEKEGKLQQYKLVKVG